MSDTTEGDLATLLYRACINTAHPISVPASRIAAAEALRAIAAGRAHDELAAFAPAPRPPLMVELHETVRHWDNPGLLANDLLRFVGLLEARAHRAMLEDAAA